MNDDNIETLLRKAPKPIAPETLRKKLLHDIPCKKPSKASAPSHNPWKFWPRWFPAFSAGVLILSGVIILTATSIDFFSLRNTRDQLQAETANIESLQRKNAELQNHLREVAQAKTVQSDYLELLALQKEMKQLQESQQTADDLRSEAARLQARYDKTLEAVRVLRGPDPWTEYPEMAKEADSVRCISNLKQIGLGARMWGIDHDDHLPMNFLTMSNELVNPKILTCPTDTNRVRATSWNQYHPGNASYRMLSPGVSETEVDAVYVQCPIHGHIGLADGSAQRAGPEGRLTNVNGLTKWERTPK